MAWSDYCIIYYLLFPSPFPITLVASKVYSLTLSFTVR